MTELHLTSLSLNQHVFDKYGNIKTNNTTPHANARLVINRRGLISTLSSVLSIKRRISFGKIVFNKKLPAMISKNPIMKRPSTPKDKILLTKLHVGTDNTRMELVRESSSFSIEVDLLDGQKPVLKFSATIHHGEDESHTKETGSFEPSSSPSDTLLPFFTAVFSVHQDETTAASSAKSFTDFVLAQLPFPHTFFYPNKPKSVPKHMRKNL
jgi:hypothetical protein